MKSLKDLLVQAFLAVTGLKATLVNLNQLNTDKDAKIAALDQQVLALKNITVQDDAQVAVARAAAKSAEDRAAQAEVDRAALQAEIDEATGKADALVQALSDHPDVPVEGGVLVVDPAPAPEPTSTEPEAPPAPPAPPAADPDAPEQ